MNDIRQYQGHIYTDVVKYSVWCYLSHCHIWMGSTARLH